MTTPGAVGPSQRVVLGAAVAFVAALTVALALLPNLDYAYRAPGLQISLHTADAVIALVVAYLVVGRYQLRNRTRDLLLASSLVALAVANLPLSALPQATQWGPEHLEAWAGVVTRTVGAVLFAAASLVPAEARVDPRAARRTVWGAALGAGWLLALVVATAKTLPDPMPPLSELDTSRPWVGGHGVVLAMQGLGLVLYALAARSFSRTAVRERDEFLTWVAAAAVLSAGARLNYLAFPSLYTDHLYTGDVLRLGFYLLLLVGAAREMRSFWTARVVAAVARGRTDVAREVGELLLPSIRAAGSGVSDPAVQRQLAELAAQTEAALAAVREEMEPVLAAEPFESALRAALVPLTVPTGTAVHVRADVPVPADQREGLLSLVTDAAALAAGAGAACVRIALTGDPWRLVVHAEGARAALPGVVREDFVRRLRARASEAGAEVGLVALDRPGGTTVTVEWLTAPPAPGARRERPPEGPGTADR